MITCLSCINPSYFYDGDKSLFEEFKIPESAAAEE